MAVKNWIKSETKRRDHKRETKEINLNDSSQ